MNKAILQGRLTKDVEMRYTQAAEPLAIASFSLAVNRRFKKDEADFINCKAFGKTAEFLGKYFSKGSQISVVGRIQTGSYENKEGNKVYTTDVVVEEAYFCGSKGDSKPKKEKQASEFVPIDTTDDNDLPF